MTDSEHASESRPPGNHLRPQPLTLHLGGLKGAIPTLIASGAIGLFAAALIAAVVNGQLLWVTIPLAIFCALGFVAFVSGVRRSATPRGVVIDDAGIHTTLRGTRTTSFSWDIVDVVGLSYIIRKAGEYGGRKYAGVHELELFCSIPQYETPVRPNEVGHPLRVDDDESPRYGAPGGHLRIRLNEPSASKRQEIKETIVGFNGNCLIEDFERPRVQTKQRRAG